MPGEPQPNASSGADDPELHELLERHLPKLHAFVKARLGAALRQREGTVDVVQSVCREVVEHGATFEFRGEERFIAWLRLAAHNKIREKHRRHVAQRRDMRREAEATDSVAAAAFATLMTPSAIAVGNESAAIVRDALAALSEEHRDVITMSRFVGLPHAVIAEYLDRSEAAARQLLARALARLAEELSRRGIDPAGGRASSHPPA